jgi:hypothetical protein
MANERRRFKGDKNQLNAIIASKGLAQQVRDLTTTLRAAVDDARMDALISIRKDLTELANVMVRIY